MVAVLRRIKGILVIAALWAFVWAVVGVAMGLEVYARSRVWPDGHHGGELGYVQFYAVVLAVFGAVSGACFAGILSITEQRRALNALSWKRLTIWGAIGAAVLPTVLLGFSLSGSGRAELEGTELVFFLVLIALGAGSAAGTLALARRNQPAAPPG